jgi:hypothetical protein
MSWSLSSFSVNARAEDMLSSIGRAVHIATRFEERCKFVLRLANLAEAHNQDHAATFDELIARVPKDRLLGATLTDLLKTVPVTPEDRARLHAAREARNFLAHEAASFDIHNRPSGSVHEAVAGKTSYASNNLVTHLKRTREQVRLLARGDNVISGVVLRRRGVRQATATIRSDRRLRRHGRPLGVRTRLGFAADGRPNASE